MDRGYFTLLAIVAVGVAYGLYRARRPPRTSRSGWVGLGVLGVLSAGLFLAAQAGSESLTWPFGLSLMAIVPIMFFLAIGSAVGSFLGRGKGKNERDQ
jgi:peptidoglycan/LPS O-acetylase OafA/YrhL